MASGSMEFAYRLRYSNPRGELFPDSLPLALPHAFFGRHFVGHALVYGDELSVAGRGVSGDLSIFVETRTTRGQKQPRKESRLNLFWQGVEPLAAGRLGDQSADSFRLIEGTKPGSRRML